MAWTFNGKIIREGRSWTGAKGIKHPTGWGRWSEAEKLAAGLVWQDDPAPYDNRFWWDANTPKELNDVNETDEDGNAILGQDGTQVVTLGLKSVWKNIIKQQAAGLLSPTDWYITRNAETGAEIPTNVATYRAAVRTKSGEIEAAIDATTTHAEFIALFNAPVDSDLMPIGNAPIADWPKA